MGRALAIVFIAAPLYVAFGLFAFFILQTEMTAGIALFALLLVAIVHPLLRAVRRRRVACPRCGEMIVHGAIVCRYCGTTRA